MSARRRPGHVLVAQVLDDTRPRNIGAEPVDEVQYIGVAPHPAGEALEFTVATRSSSTVYNPSGRRVVVHMGMPIRAVFPLIQRIIRVVMGDVIVVMRVGTSGMRVLGLFLLAFSAGLSLMLACAQSPVISKLWGLYVSAADRVQVAV
jgi:hypothetical protein